MRMVAPRTGAPEVTIAEDQEEYSPLVAAVYCFEGQRTLLTRWRLSDEDRARIAAGEDLYLSVMTFNNPLQPVSLQVGAPEWSTEAPAR
jgi:hypothetical protein